MAEEALSTNVIGKGYKVLSGVWKAMRRNIEQEKSLDALKESVMKRQLLVEAFYKRAGTLVKDYLKDHGQWQLRVDGSRQKNAKVEQMTKLNFDYANLDGSFSTFYTIQPIKLTCAFRGVVGNGDNHGALGFYNVFPIELHTRIPHHETTHFAVCLPGNLTRGGAGRPRLQIRRLNGSHG